MAYISFFRQETNLSLDSFWRPIPIRRDVVLDVFPISNSSTEIRSIGMLSATSKDLAVAYSCHLCQLLSFSLNKLRCIPNHILVYFFPHFKQRSVFSMEKSIDVVHLHRVFLVYFISF